jgi:arsenate reductase (glutaredoxin)
MITLYGITNCDTVKKARRWLADHGVEYRFHDYRKDGLDESRLRAWVEELGIESLLNRKGTTWRRLPPEVQTDIDQASAIRLMLEQPSLIRRPLLDTGAVRLVGFSEAGYRDLFS